MQALQYRYCVPRSLFEDTDTERLNDANSSAADQAMIDETNSTETCEILMHIISQNKKLPISKYLNTHRPFCIGHHSKNNSKSFRSSPSRSMTTPEKLENADFGSSDIHNTFTKSVSRSQRGGQCCKECVVSKFKYIIEKYVKNIDINLPSPIHFRLLNIYNQLQIKDPSKRFVDFFKKPKANNHKKRSMERELSKSKSKSKLNILSKIKRPKSLSIGLSKRSNPGTPKRSSILEEDEVIKIEEKEEAKEDVVESNKVFKIKNVFKRSVNRQSTISSNTAPESTITNLPSTSFSPKIIIPNTETKMDEIGSVSNNQSNKPSIHSNVSNTSNCSNGTEILTPTEIEDETEEPLPSTPNKELTTTTTNSTSSENVNGNETKDAEEEVKEMSVNDDSKDAKEEEEESEEKEHEHIMHDGFGNINYLTVFDEAILEILKLIKSDTWPRFRSWVICIFAVSLLFE